MKTLGIIFSILTFAIQTTFSQSTDQFIAYEALNASPMPLNLREVRMNMEYPKWAINAQLEGKVVVGIQVDKQGNYISHRVLKSIHPDLSAIVQAHVHELNFVPALKNGQAVVGVINIPFAFKLVTPLEQKIREAKDMLYMKRKAKTWISESP